MRKKEILGLHIKEFFFFREAGDGGGGGRGWGGDLGHFARGIYKKILATTPETLPIFL